MFVEIKDSGTTVNLDNVAYIEQADQSDAGTITIHFIGGEVLEVDRETAGTLERGIRAINRGVRH